MVASVIGKIFDIPVVLRHAGSDIGRMRNLGGLKGFYDWALSNAARLITGRKQEAIDILKSAGVGETAIVRCRGRQLCDSFSNLHEKLDVKSVIEHSADWFPRYELESGTLTTLNEWNQSSFDCEGPVIGTYGKVAEVKGTYHLLDALEQLADRGEKFCYRGIWSATPKRLQHALRYLHNKPSLKGKVTILPPMAPWQIPSFIRSCSAVAFLENRFPIGFHGPQVPREVLACKRPLLLSREIFNKVYFRDQLAEEVNVMVIEDPQEVSQMADQISRLLNNPELLSCLGHHAGALSRVLEAKALRYDPIVEVIEDVGGYERRTQAVG
jgi:glycosyltransferase involved in cell wall biosynthesis